MATNTDINKNLRTIINAFINNEITIRSVIVAFDEKLSCQDVSILTMDFQFYNVVTFTQQDYTNFLYCKDGVSNFLDKINGTHDGTADTFFNSLGPLKDPVNYFLNYTKEFVKNGE